MNIAIESRNNQKSRSDKPVLVDGYWEGLKKGNVLVSDSKSREIALLVKCLPHSERMGRYKLDVFVNVFKTDGSLRIRLLKDFYYDFDDHWELLA